MPPARAEKVERVCPVCGKIHWRLPCQASIVYCSRACYGVAKLRTPVDVWNRIERGEPDACWGWTGAVMPNGYGYLKFQRRLYYPHRLIWELTYGPIPEGMMVCHTCDNRRCCNPAHLFLGTHWDNMADMMAKGRSSAGKERPSAQGELHFRAKLTDEMVREIRTRYAAGGVTQTRLAEEYGVAQTLISRVILRKGWKHL